MSVGKFVVGKCGFGKFVCRKICRRKNCVGKFAIGNIVSENLPSEKLLSEKPPRPLNNIMSNSLLEVCEYYTLDEYNYLICPTLQATDFICRLINY